LPAWVTTIVVAANLNWLSPKSLLDSLKAQVPEKFDWANKPAEASIKTMELKSILKLKEMLVFMNK
jgi:hypothetical protein